MELSEKDEKFLEEVHPDLASVVRLAAEKTTIRWRITEGVRSLERQKKLKAQGKSKTLRSRHLEAPNGWSHAVDIVCYNEANKITWQKRYYTEASKAFKTASEELGIPIEWGGDWKSFFDGPHFQLPWATYPGTSQTSVKDTTETSSGLNKKVFYDTIRRKISLTTQNVSGFDKVLDFGYARNTPKNHLAYILATAYWETAQTMQPVVEAYWKNDAWRKRNLRYYPWHGRGLIQTTWKDNYIKIGKLIGKDLTQNPDLLLEWEYSLPALFVGMEEGLYTGKDLDDYIDLKDESDSEDLREYKAARRIVNGTDKASSIASLALSFEKGLTAAGYPVIPSNKPVEELIEEKGGIVPEIKEPSQEGSLMYRIILALLKAIFGVK